MKFISLLAVLLSFVTFGQEHHPQNGIKESKAKYYAFQNARIVTGPQTTIEEGTMLIKGDEIIEIGKKIKLPKETIVIDCKGKTILPSFIELNSEIGLPDHKREPWSFRPQITSNKKGAYYWNESIHPETKANDHFNVDAKAVKAAQQMGFGLALSHHEDGIAQGTGTLIAMSDNEFTAVQKSELAAFYSFNKGVSRQSYPSSLMGSIALFRQALYDMQWYEKGLSPTVDLSLEALVAQKSMAKFFNVTEEYEILRAQKVADEFGMRFNYLGTGHEYLILDDLLSKNLNVVVPLNFPVAFDVQDPYLNRHIPLSDLKHWEMAPYNAKMMSDKGISMAFSAKDVSSKDFWTNIQKMIETGLSANEILAALTTQPAKMIGVEKQYGQLQKGFKAFFTIYDKHPFEEKAQVLEAWVAGERNIIEEKQTIDVRGEYNLSVDNKKLPLSITGTLDAPKAQISIYGTDTTEIKPKFSVSGNDIVMQFNVDFSDWNGSVNLKGKFNERLKVFEGSGQLPNGTWTKWSGVQNKAFEEKDKEAEDGKFVVDDSVRYHLSYPNMAYGFDSLPEKETIIFKNVKVWTNTDEGILENSSVAVVNGKIAAIGKSVTVSYPKARIIDGEGMHLTPGIIDEHSHIAITRGVNEGGQAISAEVSIGDVVKSNDINVYRQLAGGVTAAQLLHGSANPIGGQSALIKLKWGYTPDKMLIPNADGFIKCALGENVKQANWGAFNNVRFPQTRMGVEQVFNDGFNRALAYKKVKASGQYRTDLELETLLEILDSKRFISCHSYVQSEINMLMHIGDKYGFTINTFTHILEGYKVAGKMAKHGAGGSTFSDWWGYKYEVRDAIPYNASLMMEQGVVVAINSDDPEMARRLNQEAAKGIKYGGMTEEQALKMVTLNPAKLLHLDDRMGSIKRGMDADLVLWSDHPLSVQAKAEYTMVDGEILFDRAMDAKLQIRDASDRARIISLMLEDNKKGKKSKKVDPKKKAHYHCDTMGEGASTESNGH